MVQLVFQTAFIGDLLLSSALLKQIRHSHPQDKIVLVCRKGCGDLMLSLGFADEVFEIDKRRPGAWRALREQFRARGWLGAGGGRMLSGGGAAAGGAFGGEGPRDVGDDAVSTNTAMSGDEGRVYANEESGIASISRTNTREGESMTNTGRANAFERARDTIDNVFCPHESFTSARFVRSLRARRKIGFKKWWNFFAFDVRVRRPMQWPEPLRQLSLLAAVDDRVKAEFDLVNDKIPLNLETRASVAKWPLPVPEFASIHVLPKESDVRETLAKFDLDGESGLENEASGRDASVRGAVDTKNGDVANVRAVADAAKGDIARIYGLAEASKGDAESATEAVEASKSVPVTAEASNREVASVYGPAGTPNGDVVNARGATNASSGKPASSDETERTLVFIAPGSVWATKRWTLDGFVAVTKYYLQRGYTVCLTGSSGERELCEQVVKRVGLNENAWGAARAPSQAGGPDASFHFGRASQSGSRDNVSDVNARLINLAGRTSLVELHRLFTRAHVVISNDSSPIHLAALAGAPTVAIFGPTTLRLGFRPWNDRSVVAQLDMNCRPCGLHGHKACPLGHHGCMTKLDASEVIRLAEAVAARG